MVSSSWHTIECPAAEGPSGAPGDGASDPIDVGDGAAEPTKIGDAPIVVDGSGDDAVPGLQATRMPAIAHSGRERDRRSMVKTLVRHGSVPNATRSPVAVFRAIGNLTTTRPITGPIW
jgi:hypothetical protein